MSIVSNNTAGNLRHSLASVSGQLKKHQLK